VSQAQVLADLQRENVQLRQTVAQQQQVLHQRAEPLVAAVIDALNMLCALAAQGHPAAPELLKGWHAALANAEAACGRIQVVRVQPNGHAK